MAYINYEHGGLVDANSRGDEVGRYEYTGLVRILGEGDRWPHIARCRATGAPSRRSSSTTQQPFSWNAGGTTEYQDTPNASAICCASNLSLMGT
ncbi:hypothetical protein EV192_1011753 [Actinocrispum wychmicini]|uniref:Uncharacterized protein n=1 Tax=Actinocrispum wychmicini TaxID=1213861 RepID=A0A4R2JZA9_9PSEU|nr:hypothetical protein EV192_1011753 [Actinocrispum wychmicini]